jgi:hypothetical protein
MRKRNFGRWVARLAGSALLLAFAVASAGSMFFTASDFEWL